jgi:MFS family permease
VAANAESDRADTPRSDGFNPDDGIIAPLRNVVFRRIWFASLISNLGTLIQGVGVAWAMTQMSSSADMVALVQTALGLPVMLIAVLAGAVADVHDRRVVALVSLGIALTGATVLAVLAALGMLTPNSLLALCFAVGCGMGLMGPAWASAVGEQVPTRALPAAVALNSISYNIARSVGPAIGGIVVAAAGTVAAFVLNALFYVPLMVALYLWNRVAERPRLPPEELGRAMVSGVRYIAHSPPIKIVLTRSTVMGMIGGAILALMPLVAKDLLHGGARTYGLMFSAFGVGAVLGALNITRVRERMGGEEAIRACAVAMGAAIAVVALSSITVVTVAALVIAGAAWIIAWTLFSIGVQLSVPRWVQGRALAAYQATSSGGVAIGAWAWGDLTDAAGVEITLLVSAALMLASAFIGAWLRMPVVSMPGEDTHVLEDPVVRLPLTGSEGPLVVENEYRVKQENAREFCRVMEDVQLSRQRNGAYGWSISRDIADPELWMERYHCPTWHEYLRLRNRPTQSERELQQRALDFHIGPGVARVRRMLEGPIQ